MEHADGMCERLVCGDGLPLILPADDPEGCGGQCADLPKLHPRNQSLRRHIRFTELRAIHSSDEGSLRAGVGPL